MFKSRQSEITVTLKPFVRIFPEKEAEEMPSKETLQVRCEHKGFDTNIIHMQRAQVIPMNPK